MKCSSDRTGFVEAVSWMGAPPYRLLVYVICPKADQSIITEIKELWSDTTEFQFFQISDSDWPFEIALVEIRVQDLDDSVDVSIGGTLRALSTKFDIPCLFMFEGGFSDYHNLFKAERQLSVYGICMPGAVPFVGTVDEARKSIDLTLALNKARVLLAMRYPDVDAIPL